MRSLFLILGIFVFQTVCAETNVLAFAGSARNESLNKQLVNDAARIAREMGANVTVIDLKEYPIPLYDGDLEESQGLPANAKKIRDLLIKNQVILIASPEYNGSVSPLLKNLIDWASRNEQNGASREAFKGKKIAIMSASPGGKGGARGLVHLRAILTDVGATVISKQLSVPNAYNAFNETGKLKDPKLQQELVDLVTEAVKN